jgi:hypothetical protein
MERIPAGFADKWNRGFYRGVKTPLGVPRDLDNHRPRQPHRELGHRFFFPFAMEMAPQRHESPYPAKAPYHRSRLSPPRSGWRRHALPDPSATVTRKTPQPSLLPISPLPNGPISSPVTPVMASAALDRLVARCRSWRKSSATVCSTKHGSR